MNITQCQSCRKIKQPDGTWIIEDDEHGQPIRSRIPEATPGSCPVCQSRLEHLEDLNERASA
jgi:hypothetical protein